MTETLKKMMSKLTGAYNKSPDGNIAKLFSLFSDFYDRITDTLGKIRIWHSIDTASGIVLDRLGSNFGVLRAEADDVFYRLMIKVKVFSLLSGGDANTIIRASSTLFGVDESHIELNELFPAKVRVIVNAEDMPEDNLEYVELTAPMLKRIMPAGVGKEVVLRKTECHDVSVPIATALFTSVTLSLHPVIMTASTSTSIPVASAAFVFITTTINAVDNTR